MVFRRVMTIVLGVLLLSSIVFPLQVAAPDILQPEEHEPIMIDGNEDLVTTASAEGWLGTGSEESPIIIKGLSITSETYGIYIANVDMHFKIEDCLITESEIGVYWDFGILLENCSQASIENCVIWNHEFGICLSNSDDAFVKRTVISESFFGVFVNWSSNVWLHSLDIVACKVGVRLNHTIYTYIDQTIIDHCEYSGIESICDSGTLLRHNAIIGSEVGLTLALNENWVLEESAIWSCDIGIVASHSNGGYVIRTMIKNCSFLGISLQTYSNNITIVENWLGPNNTQNAQDDGEGNMWYDEFSQIGNYWSDYSGEGPYTILGSAESVDLYPTSLEDAPSWEDVVTIDDGPSDTTSTGSTTIDDNPLGEPALIVAAASTVVILLVVIAMLRSRVSPGVG